MAIVVTSFIYFGYPDIGWLLGMSVAIIGLIVLIFREAIRSVRFIASIVFFFAIHLGLIVAASLAFGKLPVRALFSLGIPDFLAMGYMLPRLTGLEFDED